MKKIEIFELKENFFDTIGKEWMLVTAGGKNNFNMMTASWGCIGWLWNKPVAVVFIRPERFTHDFIERENKLTLSFLGNGSDARKAYNLCGSKSGRDFDKIALTGLTPVEISVGCMTFEQSRLTLECAKLYKDNIKPNCFVSPEISKWYGGKNGGYHDAYVLEILNAYINETFMT